jgi:hypothetical protein
MKAFALLAFLLSFACAAWASDVTLVTVEGEEISGPLESLGAESIRVKGRDVPSGDLAEIRFRNARQAAKDLASLRFRNGDLLYGTVVSGGDKSLRFNSTLLGELDVKNDLLAGVAFPVKEPPAAEVLTQFFAVQSGDNDQVLAPNGEMVNCFLNEMTNKEITYDVEGQKRSRPFDQMAAFRYAALKPFERMKGLLARVQLSDGSVLSGKLGTYQDKKLSVTGGEGMTWNIHEAVILSVGFAGGRLVYLDELEPKAEQKPLVGGAPVLFHWRKNLSASAGSLAIGRKEYLRGLGVHSFCKLTFQLEGKFTRFLADVGLDRAAGPRASCVWKVLADGQELKSGEAKAGEPAATLKLPVSGVKILELVCDYGPDEDDAGDLLDWSEARLVKD